MRKQQCVDVLNKLALPLDDFFQAGLAVFFRP